MSETYICRCGEKKEPCYSCVNQTCNMLRNELKAKDTEIEQYKRKVKQLENECTGAWKEIENLKYELIELAEINQMYE